MDRKRLVADLTDELPYLTTIDRLRIKYIIWRARHRIWGKLAIKTAAIPLAVVFSWVLTRHLIFTGLFVTLVWYYSTAVLRIDKL